MAKSNCAFDLGLGFSQPTGRFATYNSDELAELQKKKLSKRTDLSTQNGMNVLRKFCDETQIANSNELSTLGTAELNELLVKFYAGARKNDGKRYEINAYKSIRCHSTSFQ